MIKGLTLAAACSAYCVMVVGSNAAAIQGYALRRAVGGTSVVRTHLAAKQHCYDYRQSNIRYTRWMHAWIYAVYILDQ